MNSRLIHDQTFTGCSGSIMGCTQDDEEQDHRVKQKGKIVDGKIMKRITNLRFEISNRKVCACCGNSHA
jgi:hypothetical protein